MAIYIVDADGDITTTTYDNIANLEAWQREMNELYGDMWFEDYNEALEQSLECIRLDLISLRLEVVQVSSNMVKSEIYEPLWYGDLEVFQSLRNRYVSGNLIEFDTLKRGVF